MTNEEAKEWVDITRMSYICDPNECGLEKGKEPCPLFHCDDKHDALAIAIKAFDKQIPKKPRAFYLGGDPFSYRCSACDMTIKAGDTFCKWCGQAQEWKEPKK